jgi:hypothetical protein
MHHSFNKLELLLKQKGFSPVNAFTIDGYCVYIEIVSNITSDNFILYIPSKFNIKAEKCPNHELKYVETTESQDILSKYAQQPDKKDIKNDYGAIEIDSKNKDEDMETSLSQNYNNDILLKDLKKEDKECLKDIFRQLDRFKFCVQSINYKLGIMYKNYLCVIKKDDTIECYFISTYPDTKTRKLFVSIDLKNMYEKIDHVLEDVKLVKTSIYKILNQNHVKHSKLLTTMLENKERLNSYSEMIYKKKDYYEKYIAELEAMLIKLNENETELLKEKQEIQKIPGEYGVKGVHVDIQNSHATFKIDSKLQKNREIKVEIINDLHRTRLERENITLEIDRILFDNAVMLNEIVKNFNILPIIIG